MPLLYVLHIQTNKKIENSICDIQKKILCAKCEYLRIGLVLVGF